MNSINPIKSRRLACGLKQYELAAKAGIHPSHMGLIEGGRLKPTARQAQMIAEALECEPHMIFLGKGMTHE